MVSVGSIVVCPVTTSNDVETPKVVDDVDNLLEVSGTCEESVAVGSESGGEAELG